jgi:hypothetical protein
MKLRMVATIFDFGRFPYQSASNTSGPATLQPQGKLGLQFE